MRKFFRNYLLLCYIIWEISGKSVRKSEDHGLSIVFLGLNKNDEAVFIKIAVTGVNITNVLFEEVNKLKAVFHCLSYYT